MVILLTPEELRNLMRSPAVLDRMRFALHGDAPEVVAGRLLLSFLEGPLSGYVPANAKVVVDAGPSDDYRDGFLAAPPEKVFAYRNEAEARQARRRALDHAFAERAARGLRTLVFAWHEAAQMVTWLEVTTDDGYLSNRARIDSEVLVSKLAEDSLTYVQNNLLQELRVKAGEMIRRELGWPAHQSWRA